MHEHKIGRPPLPAGDRKDKSVRVRLSTDELINVQKKAEEEQTSVSSYIRERIKNNG